MNPTILPQQKEYNSLSNDLSQHKGCAMNLNILPQQNDFNTNLNNLPQQKEYNTNNLLQLKEHDDLPKKKGCNMKQNYEKGRIPSLSSSCVTRGSIGQQCRLSQSGRSMVEMLGVLAIIGVLSVGGIMGYSYGMDKYRTNETINEINLRLTTLQTQTLSGGELNLNEFAPSTGLGYTVGENYGWAEDDTKIYIGFSGIPEQVCEMVYEAMITEVDRIDVTTSQESTSLCGKDNEMKFYIDSGVEAICEPPCAAGEHCVDGVTCVAEGKTTAPLCSETKPCEGECIECFSQRCQPTRLNAAPCNEGAGMCMNGICVPNPEEEVAVCSTNEQCPVGTYCATKRASVCDESKLQAYGCAPLDFVHQTITLNNGKQETWYASRQVMDYWNAKRACEAMGKRMPTYAELLQEGRAAKIERALSRYLGWVWTQTSCNDTCLSRKAYGWQGWGCHGVSNASVFYALCR